MTASPPTTIATSLSRRRLSQHGNGPKEQMTMERQSFHGIVEAALAMITDGSIIGLGSGRAATAFIEALGVRVRAGLRVTGVPTSEASAALARRLGIPLTTLDETPCIDVDVDGADE